MKESQVTISVVLSPARSRSGPDFVRSFRLVGARAHGVLRRTEGRSASPGGDLCQACDGRAALCLPASMERESRGVAARLGNCEIGWRSARPGALLPDVDGVAPQAGRFPVGPAVPAAGSRCRIAGVGTRLLRVLTRGSDLS